MIARIALVLYALLAATGCSLLSSRSLDAAQGAFVLQLLLRQEEISKDSNEQTTEIAIQGRRVTYAWTYSGFHPDPDYRREIRQRARLSQAELDAIQETIRTRDLLRSVEESRPVGDLGIAVAIELEVEMEGQTASIRIQGMQRIREGSAARTSLTHASTVEGVEALVSQVGSIVEGR
jgi:hypothetical protein